MVGFVLTIALVNIGVGFAAAVYLGWRHRHLLALEMNSSQLSFPTNELFPSAASEAAPAAVFEAAAEALSQEAIDSAVDAADAPEADSSPDSAVDPAGDSAAGSTPRSAVDTAEDSAAGSTPKSAVDAAEDSAAGSTPKSAVDAAVAPVADSAEVEQPAVAASESKAPRGTSPEAVDSARSPRESGSGEVLSSSVRKPGSGEVPSPASRERGPAEIAMTDLRGQIRSYQDQVLDIDGLLRQLSQSPDAPKVEACVKTFQEVNEHYLKASGKSLESLQQSQAAGTLGAPALEGLRAAVTAQTQRIESAQAAIKSVDYEGDPAKVCRQMTGQTAQLANANHALRDALDQAWATASAAQKWPTPADEASADGMLVGLANQTGLEAALAKWREAEAESTKSMCMAAIDLDRFARVNERYGPRTGDRLLHSLAQLLVREGSHNNVVGRISGQRFVVMFPETDLRFTTSVVERIRQIVELSHFHYGDEDIRVTVCCAVIEAKPREDLAAMLARADAAIQEAKRYGRNRTFLYEGEYPTPVVPPNFSLEERSVSL